ncbi:hypothetical protein SPRG_05612 [Saprolegnia parasitica CBS 223.65]|uniref:DUF1640 domain-containing protein n=1 Tax=Saprolegnia parasitica (strain CBS 223.65) TaxID=695850 RepID=A0A067CKD3_SAPPC|nr:hypothetical protein SPRG_05612 [Saprolegnia parasitica CBS 223.65]KDO29660.1 hypothetical protein SPRG_05612 [Saprolegnia parasitica CBS 223.65]|eukprot:XP_012199718.1 hypothetical protein SPRG_05612 [Saprolegnia parasitica CBS 223.65]
MAADDDPRLCTAGIHFDTYRFAQNLRAKGFTPKEADVILAATRNAIQEMNTSRASLYIPKADHLELKTDLSQRVLRSTMELRCGVVEARYDGWTYCVNLKNDIRMTEKLDFDKVRFELLKVEKEFLLQKKTDEETLNTLHIANERLEKRILQFVVGFSGSMMLVLARLGAFF